MVEARGLPTTTEMFLPYLSGERTPHNDPNAKGVMFGLTHETDTAALGQAVLEGVAFAFRDGLDALLDSGATLDTITVIGGGARSAYWGKILASALGRPLIYRDGGAVGPAFGAARLARLGLGTDAIEDVCAPPPIIDIVEPDERLSDRFTARRPAFRHLYSTLKSSFTETA
jgi:xylulokinase